jgi:hypothetical protein
MLPWVPAIVLSQALFLMLLYAVLQVVAQAIPALLLHLTERLVETRRLRLGCLHGIAEGGVGGVLPAIDTLLSTYHFYWRLLENMGKEQAFAVITFRSFL